MRNPRPNPRGPRSVLAPLFLTLLLLLPTQLLAQTEGDPLGSLYLSAADDHYVSSLDVGTFTNFNWYLVVEIDYADVGLPEQQAVNGLKGWEAGVDVPATITVLNRTLRPATSLNIGQDDNWIIGTGQLVRASDTPYAVVAYTALLLSAQTDLQLHVKPASPSSFVPASAGWVEYHPSGECQFADGSPKPCLRRFTITKDFAINPTVEPLPIGPTDLVATTLSSDAIQLDWTDNSDNEDAFVVMMASNAEPDFVLVDTVLANFTTTVIDGLDPQTVYFFRVYAENETGRSLAYAETAGVTFPEVPPSGEGSPLGALYLSEIPDGYDGEMDTPGAFTPFPWYLVVEIDYNDIGLPEQQESNGFYGWETGVALDPALVVLQRQLLPETSINVGENENWIVGTGQHVPANATPYAVLEYTGMILEAGLGALEVSLGPATPSSFDPPEPGWAEYEPSGECFLADGSPRPCLRPFATTANLVINPTSGTPPAPPSDLMATPLGPDRIQLEWTDNSDDETAFLIYRALDPAGEFEWVRQTDANATSALILGLLPETTYWFRVFSANAAGSSDGYAEDFATTLPLTLPGDMGEPLGALYVSAMPNGYQGELFPEPFAPFDFYIVAEIDYADIGLPEFQEVNGLLAWESKLEVPPELIVISRTLSPETSLNVGEGLDNWIIGTGQKVPARGTPYALVHYQAMLPSEGDLVALMLQPSTPTSFDPPAPGWLDYLPVGECFRADGTPTRCLRPFAATMPLILNPFFFPEPTLRLDVGSAYGDLGEIVTVPVTVALDQLLVKSPDLSAVAGIDLRLVWDPSIGSFVGGEPGGANANWLYAENSGEGFVEISMADPEGIQVFLDPVEIARLSFQLANQPGTGTLTIAEANVYDTTPESFDWFATEGMLVAGCDKFDVFDDDQINSADAVLTLRIAVELVEPTPDQFCAADVIPDGEITSGDALRILQRAVGLDLVAKAPKIGPARVSLSAGGMGELFLHVQDAAALDAVLRLDGTGLRLEQGFVDGEGLVATNLLADGRLKLAWAATKEGEATVRVHFDTEDLDTAGIGVELSEATAYGADGLARDTEKEIWQVEMSTQASTIPTRSQLVGAFPNPFNPQTEIRLRMARPGDATLRLVDMAGRLVRTIHLMGLPAGESAVQWNGTDDHGRTVASGVYFVQMAAADAKDAIRITLLK